MSLDREGVLIKLKSHRSPRYVIKRQLVGLLLTDSAHQSNAEHLSMNNRIERLLQSVTYR